VLKITDWSTWGEYENLTLEKPEEK
jgi:hypothetical protein